MPRPSLAVVLGAALVVSIGLNVYARLPKRGLGIEYLPNMARTPRYNAFEENPNFSDGMTLRAPAPGTIPRGLPPLPAGEDAALMVNPFQPGDGAAAERGAAVFAAFCQPCHGAAGEGDGPVPQHGFPVPPPLSRAQTQDKTDAQMFLIVTNGQNSMPSYASQISRDDRWKAILHVRSMRRAGAETGAK
ncbi:MAG: cytochrome c [Acidobacteriota bacterium]